MTHVSGAEGEGNWMRLMVPVDEEGKGKALGFSCDDLQLTGMLSPDLSLCSQQPHTIEISPYHSPHPRSRGNDLLHRRVRPLHTLLEDSEIIREGSSGSQSQ